MTFRDLGLIAPILSALEEQGYTRPSPIQEKAIPPALEGRDVLGCAQTGTGKTCAFAAPILQRLSAAPVKGRPIRALILTPTRELAIQIGDSFQAYGSHLSLRHAVIFGGVGQNPQVEALNRGVDILVATPGRLMDLHDQGFVHLEQLEIFVLDEADRMLDMGFIHDVKKILKWLPARKQTMLFSATMPPEIADLVNSLLRSPVRVAVDPVSSPVEAIRQSVYFVDKGNKTRLLAQLIQELAVKNALVFTRTKHGANKVARELSKYGITAAAIHGNKSQTARQQALADFRAGKLQALVATDIAARGLDIEELSHVFNYNLPEVPETYVHRIGRTGRAGRGGEAIAFCDFSEKPLLREIEKLTPPLHPPWWRSTPGPCRSSSFPKRIRTAALSMRRTPRPEPPPVSCAGSGRPPARPQLRRNRRSPLRLLPRPQRPRWRAERRRSAAAGGASPRGAPAAPAESPLPAQAPARPKLTRPGTRLETGSAMPCTEFDRPDPLAGDRIMDATARLLAPRRLTLSPVSSREEHGRPRKRSAGQAAQPRQKSEGQKGRSAHTAPQAESRKPAPSKHKKSSQGRGQDRRRSFQDPPRPTGHPKDSTEQESLMKPYYLDI